MMQKQKLHRVSNRLPDALRIGANFHFVRDRRRTGGRQFRRAFNLHETHAATALDANIGMVTIPRDLDAHIIRHLDDGFALLDVVCLVVDRDLRHNELD